MEQLDSLYSQQLESLLRTTSDISHNTDAWDGFVSGAMTLITLFAALATIAGLFLVRNEILRRRYTKKRQSLIIKDMIRHLFVNATIMEALDIKSQGKWDTVHPAEGVLTRFSFLESDFLLGGIQVEDEQFVKLHSLSVFLRNYNIVVEIAERNFQKQSVSVEEKESEIIDIWKRTERLVKELLELGISANLLSSQKAAEETELFIKSYYKTENESIISCSIPKREGVKSIFDGTILHLKEEFDKNVTRRLIDLRVIVF